jgi:hypothetical protein
VNENIESKGKKFVSPSKDRKILGQNQFLSPSNNNMNPLFQEPDLNGLVKIKAYESQLTDEIP